MDGGLCDRPPLAAETRAKGFDEFTVFSNHFASKVAPDACREAQAAFVRDRLAELKAAGKRSIVAGDLNAFEDDGVLTTLEDGTTTALDNLWDTAPAEERYSFAFQGRLQTLDHVLVTRGLASKVEDFRYAHFDNDYHEREDRAEPDGHHVSDHAPPVLTRAGRTSEPGRSRPAASGRAHFLREVYPPATTRPGRGANLRTLDGGSPLFSERGQRSGG